MGERQMPEEGHNTAKTLRFFDKLFDTLNGPSPQDKPNPHRTVMTNDSFHEQYLREAKGELHKMRFVNKETHKPEAASVPCLGNLEKTIDGFLLLWKKMKSLGFTSLNTRFVNQDPLENFFGLVRSHCERNINPTCAQFYGIFKSLLINNLTSSHSVGSNCAPDDGRFILSWATFENERSEPELPNLEIPEDNNDELPFQEKGHDFSSAESFIKDAALQNNSLKTCPECTKLLTNSSQPRTAVYTPLHGLHQNMKLLLQTIMPKIYTSNDVRKRACKFLELNANFDVLSCAIHRCELIASLTTCLTTNYILSITTFLNQVLNGKIALSDERHTKVVLTASEKYKKTLHKKYHALFTQIFDLISSITFKDECFTDIRVQMTSSIP